MNESGLTDQGRIVTALLDAKRYPHPAKTVKLVETHISWVLLAGRYAYKIKKAVHPGFLDFTRLAARLYYCNEEIRLNRRTAPKIYLDVVPIGGSFDNPVMGSLPSMEYAVRMKRFPSGNTLDRLAERGKLLPAHLDLLAAKIASFHENLPPAGIDSGYGVGMLEVARASFDELRKFLDDDLSNLEKLVDNEYASCADCFPERLKQGFVRECHGDLHLGNIALVRGGPTPFDCIEFDPKLRWIDVMNEMAFPVMDLLYHDRRDLAYRFLNAYLERTGDYGGMKAFRFHLSCRAVVRAMVDAMRDKESSCRKHLALAAAILSRRRPFLIITHGLPGSGKTTLSQAALEKLGAIRIRSDVERKRLASLPSEARSHSGIASGIYSPDASRATYSRLLELARGVLSSGFPVIIDAAFLSAGERGRFRKLAQNLSVPFIIASLKVPRSSLEERILARKNDASDADLAVLDALEVSSEPLQPGERNRVVQFSCIRDEKAWEKLELGLGLK
ncbi:MAG: bifunctional aminoglycoside phosphotransferase/ATP-binding protein [Burkholderiales bacterium]